jgi:sensor c-di-GMP phosphodiesterase-like protein
VVAEGIEDPRAFALLRELGCDAAQGYYMSPPLAADAFIAWLQGGPMPRALQTVPATTQEVVRTVAVGVR